MKTFSPCVCCSTVYGSVIWVCDVGIRAILWLPLPSFHKTLGSVSINRSWCGGWKELRNFWNYPTPVNWFYKIVSFLSADACPSYLRVKNNEKVKTLVVVMMRGWRERETRGMSVLKPLLILWFLASFNFTVSVEGEQLLHGQCVFVCCLDEWTYLHLMIVCYPGKTACIWRHMNFVDQ